VSGLAGQQFIFDATDRSGQIGLALIILALLFIIAKASSHE
jgi:hypothetical protein